MKFSCVLSAALAVAAAPSAAGLQVWSDAQAERAELKQEVQEAAAEQADALKDLQAAQERMKRLNDKIAARAENEIRSGNVAKGQSDLAQVNQLKGLAGQIDQHIHSVTAMQYEALGNMPKSGSLSFLQQRQVKAHAPEDDLAKEMTHDLEMNFNKIAPFGKEDTAKELQDHAAKTQDTLVDAVENAEVAEIKRAVFRALTRLRAATIKEFDTIARLETQAIDAYNDAHHYRAENPLAHLHEDEAPVETDKLKSFH